jgi:hypothetical protein
MNDKQIYLRNAGDNNHYLTFSGTVDGPILCGSAGGALATAVNNALTWNNSNVTVNRQLVLNAGISATSSQTIDFGTNTVTVGSLNLDGAKLLYTGNSNLVFTGTLNTPYYSDVGTYNICLGAQAMGSATGTPTNNVAMGTGALYLANSTTGTIALGSNAVRNMIGNYNVAIGSDALNGIQHGTAYDTTTYGSGDTLGVNNVAVGHSAGTVCRSGNNNTFLGAGTDINTAGNTFNNSTALGFNARITASNQIMLGTASETVKILGPTNMAGCTMTNCTVTASAEASYKLVSTGYTGVSGAYTSMYMNNGGQFAISNTRGTLVYLDYTSTAWIAGSDARLKKDIVSIDDGLHVITRLRPVSYRLKTDSDTYTPRLGFIAQEVQQVLPSIVSTNTTADEKTGVHHLGIATTDIIPHMVKAISELNDMCKAHKSEIAELKLLVQSLINK